MAKLMSLVVNDISVEWDETDRRTEKACVRCGKPTRGRMKNTGGIVEPAHVGCAIDTVMKKVLRFYGRTDA